MLKTLAPEIVAVSMLSAILTKRSKIPRRLAVTFATQT